MEKTYSRPVTIIAIMDGRLVNVEKPDSDKKLIRSSPTEVRTNSSA